MEPPAKKSRKLFDDDSSSDSGDESGGVPVNNGVTFKVNEEYARRFEHNKKREELQKLESKLGKGSAFGKRGDDESGDSDESTSEEEDDDGELATEALDAEIMATLKAIRTKDPRVYDHTATFYSQVDEDQPATSEKKQKTMTLKDYHRENLLSGANLSEEDISEAPKTYAQEQEDLKNAIVKEMHAAADNEDASADKESDDDEDFLVAKSATEPVSAPKKDVKLDVENADKDPETFLSNFLSARAWIPAGRADLKPLESDDEEDDARAEAFEEAYNFRFEDPSKINATLITHARDATNQQSVRRDEKSSRKKHREAERLKKEEEKKERETEKNRLRKLKMEELQEKVNHIKEVAGLRASEFTDEEWAKFLDDSWDDQKWEQEMQKRFGEDYYAGEGDGEKKPKKPTWDDDIDIKDIVPDFDDDDEKPNPQQSDVEMDDADDAEGDESASKNKKSKAQERRDQKREARKDRLRIEEAVDRNLDLDVNLLPGAKKHQGHFRYRETSPNSFGLTARDILMAEDTQLNEYAGLKKLASFRDPEKKRRDQKRLGKKARLRQWRKDTFGNEEGPEFVFGNGRTVDEKEGATDAGNVDIREGEPKRKKRKRSKKH
ncbi:KRI1-like family C-terminal [Aspergillus parasiticus SU-1]|uniref:KRI1-like family C-terminal-domain-containing protein n=3 Tax=Aspergillus subgen. Circumdati TaxID=2720871 RepID=A0A5N6DZE7_ASPPA|nr:KRI1-like family C-terminal-domain-containing protein [Aspergillus parasiticus]KAE8314998.1 KRI1-like family C-terminal-domain-containing protein [Aspergillus transmontanensis]KJK62423.1 KRI1-like family C-terminal [Aspergillus parasiticus SU-1]